MIITYNDNNKDDNGNNGINEDDIDYNYNKFWRQNCSGLVGSRWTKQEIIENKTNLTITVKIPLRFT